MYASQRTSTSDFEPHAIANNGVIVSASDGLRLECVSNSSQSKVGMITGLDGDALPINAMAGVWRLTNPFSRPGVLRLQTRTTSSSLPDTHQGIYTCTIPDSDDNQVVINVGLYPSGFNGELYSVCVCVLSELMMMLSSLLSQILPLSRT